MKFTKFLLAVSVAAISTSAFASAGGFYVGVNTGAQLDRYHARFSANGLNLKKKLKKTKITAEGVVGYDFHFDSIVLGMDVEFGTAFGKVKVKSAAQGEEVNRSAPWQLGFTLKVGYLVTPNCEIYLTAGARIVKHKFVNNGAKSGKKTKVHPVAGLGVRYSFAQNFFAKAEYDHLFKDKIYKFKSGGVKYQVHSFKLGFGYKF